MAFPWDDLSLVLKGGRGGVACVTIACANYQTASLHHIGSMFHVLTDLAIKSVLAHDPDADLLGPFTAADVDVELLCMR